VFDVSLLLVAVQLFAQEQVPVLFEFPFLLLLFINFTLNLLLTLALAKCARVASGMAGKAAGAVRYGVVQRHVFACVSNRRCLVL